MRPAGLGAGAGEASPPKGLHADYRADHAAVDVDMPTPRSGCVVDELSMRLWMPRVSPYRGAEPLQDGVEVASLVNGDVQDRAEDFDAGEGAERELEGESGR